MPEQLYHITQGGKRISQKAVPLAEAEKAAEEARKRQPVNESEDSAQKIEVKPFITG